jgi:hypothetical protein
MSIMPASDRSPAGATGPHWHAALALAITGLRWDAVDEPGTPAPRRLAAEIADRYPGGVVALQQMINSRRATGQPWPYEVPGDLRRGIGAAQWLAALAAVRDGLGLDQPARSSVHADRPPDADERRLLGEVPPHHGH